MVKSKYFISLAVILLLFPFSLEAQEKTIDAGSFAEMLLSGEDIFLHNYTIEGLVNFPEDLLKSDEDTIVISSSITCMNCVFTGRFSPTDIGENNDKIIQFKNVVSFLKCDFLDTVLIDKAIFADNVNFGGSIFREYFSISNCRFANEGAYLTEVKFKKPFIISNTVFMGEVVTHSSMFEEGFVVDSSAFYGKTDLNGSQFYGLVRINETSFAQKFLSEYTEYLNRISVENCQFDGSVSFDQSKFIFGAEFRNAVFSQILSFEGSYAKESILFFNTEFKLSPPKEDQLSWEKESGFLFDR